MKILLVCNTSWGMVMFRLGLMKRLVKEGYEVTVLAPFDDHSSEIEKIGCNYINLPMDNKGSNIFKDLFLLKRLYNHYKEIDPDLIFHYTIKPNVYGSIAAHLTKKSSISVITGLGFTFINSGITSYVAKKLYKISLPFAKKVWFINDEDRNKFIQGRIIPKDLMEVIPGEGVDMKKYAPRGKSIVDDKFRFVLIARLLWDKGVGELVKAASEIKKIYPHVEVQLVGFVDAKNPQAISKKQVDDWQSKGWVNYLGPTDDVREFIAEADCVVLPSYREGVSMILLEAASMAKPIIASNVPGCRDIVEHGGSGYLCNVRDPYDLALYMEKMINFTDDERKKMGIKGREHIQREFDEQIVLQKYIRTINSYKIKENSNFSLKR